MNAERFICLSHRVWQNDRDVRHDGWSMPWDHTPLTPCGTCLSVGWK
jgi:hypothetical protein